MSVAGSTGRPVGFTLVELAITLALMAVLGAMAAPPFSALVARQRLLGAAHHLQADIALARHESGRRGQPVVVQFQPGRQWCYALSTGPPADCRQARPGPANGVIKVVTVADHPGIDLLDASAMALHAGNGASVQSLLAGGHARFGLRDGQGQPGPMQVQGQPGPMQVQVRLGPQGRGSLCAPGAPVLGTPACVVASPGS